MIAPPVPAPKVDLEEQLSLQSGWYRPGKSLSEFHESDAWIRVLIGGRGSAKTTAGCVEAAIRHCWHNAGAKVLFVRKTEASQSDSTIDTHVQCYANMGDLWVESETSLFRSWNGGKTVRLPTRKAVEEYNHIKPLCRNKSELIAWLDGEGSRLCGFVEMRGLPNLKTSESKLRGFECSMLVFVEADQISERDFQLSLACLRWKGADLEVCDENGFIIATGVILDTNPPGTQHWIAKLEAEEAKKPEDDREMRFWHISTYENQHNLPSDYIDRQILLPYAKNPAMIERMLWGKYADAFEGSAVYYNFDASIHVGTDLPFPRGAYLVRSYDFGTNNSVIFSAYWAEEYKDALGNKCLDEYWHILQDQFLDGSDTDRQAAATIKTTEEAFPFYNDRTVCSGVYDYADPAGANSNFSTSKTESCAKIFNTYGIYPGFDLWERGIQNGTAIINRFLAKRDRHGNPCFRIDRINAAKTYRAFSGEYRYPEAGEPGYGSNQPIKGTLCNFADGVADATRYGMLNVMKLAKVVIEKILPPVQRKPVKNPNPKRYI